MARFLLTMPTERPAKWLTKCRSLLRSLLGLRFLVAVFPCLFAISIMTACEEIEEEKPWIHVDRPQMLFTDTTLLDSYDRDVLNWKLKTAYLERWADKEIVFVRPVLVDIYDSVGERVAFMRADSGRLDMKFTYVYAYGHVYALTPKGASVRADSLLWNKKDNQVRTDSYVRVVSEEGDVLQGKGFESDAKMDHWRILSQVTGIFQDAAKRLKDEDKKQGEELSSSGPSVGGPASAPAVHHAPPKPAPVANSVPSRPAPGGMQSPARTASRATSIAEDSVHRQKTESEEKVNDIKKMREQMRQKAQEARQ